MIEHALDAFLNMQAEANQWAAHPDDIKDIWAKLGDILRICGLDYEDLKGKTDD